MSSSDSSNYEVKRVTADNFPKNSVIKSLLLESQMIPHYPGAQSTYEMLGSDNANFLAHKAFGHCSTSYPNNSTWVALTNYFVNGTPFFCRVMIGSIPENGTTCV